MPAGTPTALVVNLASLIPGAYNLLRAQTGTIPFTLGTSQTSPEIVFGAQDTPIEIPPALNDLGGFHFHAVHEFPGGYRTLQGLGPFPPIIRWQGILLGGYAFTRSFAIDALRRTGKTAYLVYGPWKWKGLLVSYLAEPRHQNYIVYRAEFQPSVDMTASGLSAAPTAPTNTTLLNLLLSKIQSLLSSATGLSPASIMQLQTFSTLVTGLLNAVL